MAEPKVPELRAAPESFTAGATSRSGRVRPQVQAMLDWIGSRLPSDAHVLRADGKDSLVETMNALSTMGRAAAQDVGLLDSYVETDEQVGPRVSAFELREKQLGAIGRPAC